MEANDGFPPALVHSSNVLPHLPTPCSHGDMNNRTPKDYGFLMEGDIYMTVRTCQLTLHYAEYAPVEVIG